MADFSERGFTEHFYQAPDGLTLYARIYGDTNPGVPVVCLPGLTRNSRDFHRLALMLSQQATPPRRVICLDYRGRGRSERDPDPSHYNLIVEAGDVIAACARFGAEPAHFIGTSRGGLTLHLLGQMKPELLKSVVLNDIGPVLGVEGLRHIKAYLSASDLPQNWQDAARRLAAVHATAFHILQEEDWQEMADALYREDNGAIIADFDPAIAEPFKTMDLTGDVPDLWPQFETLRDVPVLVIRGENSKLLSEETVAEMSARHPDLQGLVAKGQGHAPLLHVGGLDGAIEMFLHRLP
ncbi:alpha/beta hydrolase [Rhizobium sp. RU36D]|uniref:alpha/beta fold hydrolase n=1 Tax=Rhizobium sp. RU36D TaxID=1907415 RepID=UPI0009D79F43|nr:alpha/beta hydrolase [Rhizobium sp. RU36D]SMD11427.1 Pimeloyl-ACP methyl ester carboxylesterase [Rhizobium sp. RU36D]